MLAHPNTAIDISYSPSKMVFRASKGYDTLRQIEIRGSIERCPKLTDSKCSTRVCRRVGLDAYQSCVGGAHLGHSVPHGEAANCTLPQRPTSLMAKSNPLRLTNFAPALCQ